MPAPALRGFPLAPAMEAALWGNSAPAQPAHAAGAVVVEGCCDRIPPTGPALHAPVTALPLVRQGPERVAGDVVLAHDRLVVIDQTYTPDWVARVDGKKVPLHPANVMLQSLEVPSGRHHVEVSYEPASVSLGLALSGLGVLGLMALLWLPRPLGRARPEAVGRIHQFPEVTL